MTFWFLFHKNFIDICWKMQFMVNLICAPMPWLLIFCFSMNCHLLWGEAFISLNWQHHSYDDLYSVRGCRERSTVWFQTENTTSKGSRFNKGNKLEIVHISTALLKQIMFSMKTNVIFRDLVLFLFYFINYLKSISLHHFWWNEWDMLFSSG